MVVFNQYYVNFASFCTPNFFPTFTYRFLGVDFLKKYLDKLKLSYYTADGVKEMTGGTRTLRESPKTLSPAGWCAPTVGCACAGWRGIAPGKGEKMRKTLTKIEEREGISALRNLSCPYCFSGGAVTVYPDPGLNRAQLKCSDCGAVETDQTKIHTWFKV